MKKKKTKSPEANGSSAGKGVKKALPGASMTRYFSLACISAAVCVLLAALLVHQIVLYPSVQDVRSNINEQALTSSANLFSLRLNQLRDQVSQYADGLDAERLEDEQDYLQSAETEAQRVIQHAVRGYYAPLQKASRDEAEPVPVSFASLDLIRGVEETRQAKVDAFLFNDQWYVQVAAPVRSGGTLQGTFLTILAIDALTLPEQFLPKGGVELLQTAGRVQRPVLQFGRVEGTGLESDTALPQWSVTYYPPRLVDNSKEPIFWGIALALALLAAAIVWLVLWALRSKLHRDADAMTSFVKGSLLGDKPQMPKLRLRLLQHMGMLTMQTRKQLTATSPIRTPIKPQTQEATPSKEPVPQQEVAPEATTSPAKTSEATEDEFEPLFQGDSLDIDMLGEDEDLLGLSDEDLGLHSDEPEIGVQETSMPDVDPKIFRAYDIRGVVGENLSPQVMTEIGKALGSEARQRGHDTICLGYDGRESSPGLARALSQGLQSTGVDVINIGRVPTPVLYFACHHLNVGSGAMITGSHNPSAYNGVKVVLGGETLAQEGITALYKRIQGQNYTLGEGQASQADVTQDYIDTVVGDIAVAAPLKVVVDAGNGVAGEIGPKLIEELGCDVIPIHCEIDGSFPNHHPDPSSPDNLQDLIAKVKETDADLGIAFDGDGDRLGVVTPEGKIIWPDRLLMLFAKDVVSRNPGADVIFDVKCSRKLNGLISGFGGRPVMWRTGHSLIKAKMRETGALLAGEMSGHIFFKERWYGFDDGIYSAARLLEILGIDDRSADRIFEDFPEDISTPELQVQVTEENKFTIVEKLAQQDNWGESSMSSIDGVRVEYADGWGLCRASNTTPTLVLRFEAETEAALQRIQETFRRHLNAIEPGLELPF